MIIYIVHKTSGSWVSGSSKPILAYFAKHYAWDHLHYSPNDKPLLDQDFISLSHTGSLLAIAYHHQAIGIDIEMPRPISDRLINRLHLDCNAPLESWCLKEAYIKLMDDKTYLIKPIPSNLYKQDLTIDGCVGQVVSLFPIDPIETIHLKESDLI
jgi:hypothetical protein